MWLFGLVDNNEIKALKAAGYTVKKYNENTFHKFLHPKLKPKIQLKDTYYSTFVGIYVDGRIRDILNESYEKIF